MMTNSEVGRTALVVIAVIVGAAALAWLSGILTPLVLALCSFWCWWTGWRACSGAHAVRAGVGGPALSLVLTALAFGLTVYAVVGNAAAFAGSCSRTCPG